jgi:hypothetical protein
MLPAQGQSLDPRREDENFGQAVQGDQVLARRADQQTSVTFGHGLVHNRQRVGSAREKDNLPAFAQFSRQKPPGSDDHPRVLESIRQNEGTRQAVSLAHLGQARGIFDPPQVGHRGVRHGNYPFRVKAAVAMNFALRVPTVRSK